jgi:hypothetical protein
MGKRLLVAIVLLVTGAVHAVAADGAGSPRDSSRRAAQKLLRDGSLLKGVDGRVSCSRSTDEWYFEPDSDVTVGGEILKAVTKLQLLPSAPLEAITEQVIRRANTSFRLWGRITTYKGQNFVLPAYAAISGEPQVQPDPNALEPGTELGIPQEVIAKLKTRRTIRRQPDAEPQTVVVDRVGFIRGAGFESTFALDAIGWNLQGTSFRLLPCRVLELAQRRQAAEPDPIRLKVAGIVTEYKGKKYLLLQKATRVYSHGNFD